MLNEKQPIAMEMTKYDAIQEGKQEEDNNSQTAIPSPSVLPSENNYVSCWATLWRCIANLTPSCATDDCCEDDPCCIDATCLNPCD